MELAVLCEGTSWLPLRLIESFWIRDALSFWFVMSFVDKSGTIILHLVVIRRVRTHRHEYDGVAPLQPEIHASLKASSFFLAHFVI